MGSSRVPSPRSLGPVRQCRCDAFGANAMDLILHSVERVMYNGGCAHSALFGFRESYSTCSSSSVFYSLA